MERTRLVTKKVNFPEVKEAVITPKLPEPEIIPVIPAVVSIPTPEPVNKELRWKKMGHGSFILNGRYIKQNQVFLAREDEIPVAFRDVIILLDKIPVPPVVTDATKKNPEYTVKPREGTALYDIVDRRGKQINEKPMEHEDALTLLSVL